MAWLRCQRPSPKIGSTISTKDWKSCSRRFFCLQIPPPRARTAARNPKATKFMPKTMPALHARIGAPGCLFSFSRSSDIKFQFIRMNYGRSPKVHTYEPEAHALNREHSGYQPNGIANAGSHPVHTYEPGATTGSNHGRSQFIRMNFTGSRPVHTYELNNRVLITCKAIGQLDRKAHLKLPSVHTYEPGALAYSSHVRHQFIRMNFKDSKLVHTYEPDGDAKPPRSTTACQYEPRNSGVRCFWRIEFGDLPMR